MKLNKIIILYKKLKKIYKYIKILKSKIIKT